MIAYRVLSIGEVIITYQARNITGHVVGNGNRPSWQCPTHPVAASDIFPNTTIHGATATGTWRPLPPGRHLRRPPLNLIDRG